MASEIRVGECLWSFRTANNRLESLYERVSRDHVCSIEWE